MRLMSSQAGAGEHRQRDVVGPASDRHKRLDRRVMLVVDELEIVKLVVKDGRGAALDDQLRVRKRLARKLQRHLLGVVAVDVAIATRPDEVAHAQVALLRQHVREQRVAGNVEWHT